MINKLKYKAKLSRTWELFRSHQRTNSISRHIFKMSNFTCLKPKPIQIITYPIITLYKDFNLHIYLHLGSPQATLIITKTLFKIVERTSIRDSISSRIRRINSILSKQECLRGLYNKYRRQILIKLRILILHCKHKI
jgi:hypothetical protein